jgi:hypothetical protein
MKRWTPWLLIAAIVITLMTASPVEANDHCVEGGVIPCNPVGVIHSHPLWLPLVIGGGS